jgi:hypothetical protein
MPFPRRDIAKTKAIAPKPSPSARKFADDIANAVNIGVTQARDNDTERAFLTTRAPNAIEWILREEFLDRHSLLDGREGTGDQETSPPYWGTYEFVRNVFELRCPLCNHGSPRMIGATKMQIESETLLTYDVSIDDDACPRCRNTRSDFIADGMLHGFNAAHFVGGMRSGKTFSSAYVCTYIEHVLLTIAQRRKDHQGLQEYFGLAPGTVIDMAFVASSLKTTEESIWQAYKNMRQIAPWFRRYGLWIKLQEKIQDTPLGTQKWVYSVNDTEIHNGAVHMVADSYAAASGTVVGRTRILGAVDEIGRMKDTDSAMGADEIYRGVESSLMTIRAVTTSRQLSTRWTGFMLSVSSPTSILDKSMRLLADAERVPRMYAMHRSTWEFNPYMPRDHPDIEDAYLKDPVGAERDFGANPPATKSPLIIDRVSFEEAAIDWSLLPTARFRLDGWSDDTNRYHYVGAKVVDADLQVHGTARYIAFDPGASFDAFAGACAHAEIDEDGRTITVFDWIIRIVPPLGSEVWFDGVVDIVSELRQYYTIASVEFDQWNSMQPMQLIRNLGIPSEPVATVDRHFIQFYRDAMGGRVRMLPPTEENYDIIDPALMSGPAAALYELESLDRDVDGKISNPRKGLRRGVNSDDCAHVVVHAHRLVQSAGITEKFDDMSRRARRIRAEAIMTDWAARDAGGLFNPSGVNRNGGRGW